MDVLRWLGDRDFGGDVECSLYWAAHLNHRRNLWIFLIFLYYSTYDIIYNAWIIQMRIIWATPKSLALKFTMLLEEQVPYHLHGIHLHIINHKKVNLIAEDRCIDNKLSHKTINLIHNSHILYKCNRRVIMSQWIWDMHHTVSKIRVFRNN